MKNRVSKVIKFKNKSTMVIGGDDILKSGSKFSGIGAFDFDASEWGKIFERPVNEKNP